MPLKMEVFSQNVVFFVEPKVNSFCFGGRIIVVLIMFIWGWKLILTPMATNDVGNSFLHLVNLPFHEAGHIFFRLFGRWMTSLGGTLGQLLIPIICLLAFLIKYERSIWRFSVLVVVGRKFYGYCSVH